MSNDEETKEERRARVQAELEAKRAREAPINEARIAAAEVRRVEEEAKPRPEPTPPPPQVPLFVWKLTTTSGTYHLVSATLDQAIDHWKNRIAQTGELLGSAEQLNTVDAIVR